MSPYAQKLASARLDALRTLIDALKEADTPEEKRRCAVAIFNAPDPSNLDDQIDLAGDEEDIADEDIETQDTVEVPPADAEDGDDTEDGDDLDDLDDKKDPDTRAIHNQRGDIASATPPSPPTIPRDHPCDPRPPAPPDPGITIR